MKSKFPNSYGDKVYISMILLYVWRALVSAGYVETCHCFLGYNMWVGIAKHAQKWSYSHSHLQERNLFTNQFLKADWVCALFEIYKLKKNLSHHFLLPWLQLNLHKFWYRLCDSMRYSFNADFEIQRPMGVTMKCGSKLLHNRNFKYIF